VPAYQHPVSLPAAIKATVAGAILGETIGCVLATGGV